MGGRDGSFVLRVKGLLPLFLIVCCLTGSSAADVSAAGEENAASAVLEQADARTEAPDCRKIIGLLEQQKSLLTRETGQLKRELAALREDLARPGFREVMGGIGYIFGLVGVALYVHSRRTGNGPLKGPSQ